MALPGEKPLEGWKDIAKSLGRGERTAQRWKGKGLPVYRHEALGVIAYKSELDLWIANLQKELRARRGAEPVDVDPPPPGGSGVPDASRSRWTGVAGTFRSWVFVGVGAALFPALTMALMASAYGLAILEFCLGAVFVVLWYLRGSDTPGGRSLVAVYMIAAMAYVSSGSTMPAFQATIVNATTLPPSPAYVFVTGLKFIPLLVLVFGTWVLLAWENNAGFLARPGWEQAYWILGFLMLAAELVGLALTSGDDLIWTAALPGRWTLLIGSIIVLGANLMVWFAGRRCFRQETILSYRPLFWKMTAACLVIAFASFLVDGEHNRINHYYLDKRWGEAFRAGNADAIKDIPRLLSGRLRDEVGPDLMNLMEHDAAFRENLRTGVFYKQHSDEPFQMTRRSVMFGYKPAISPDHNRQPFVTIRFPKELADVLEFRPVGE